MRIRVSNGTPPHVTVSGEIDFGNSGRLREALQRLVQDDNHRIELDLSGVAFVDSSGIGLLVNYAKMLRRRGGELRLVAYSPTVYSILFDCGLTEVVGITDGNVPTAGNVSEEPGHRWLVSSFNVPASLVSPSIIRDRIGQLVADLPLTETEAADIKLAVGEAATNAIKYGCADGKGEISVRCMADSRQLTVEISDSGPGFDRDSVRPPDFERLPTGGMGIAIIELVMDDVRFEFHCGTTVRMTKRLS